MLIDRTHRGWALATGLALGAATALYVWYAREWPGGPAGRTWPGMAFGIAGTALMAFAGLLSARKKTIRRRWGSVAWWLKGHIWLGLLSVPLVLFHAAFRWGGALEATLWWVVIIVIASGVVGLFLQNILPRIMTGQLPTEAIADQLGYACERLQGEADAAILAGCGDDAVTLALTAKTASRRHSAQHPQAELAAFYAYTVRPFLAADGTRDSALRSERESELIFERLRESLPYELGPLADQLQGYCVRRRQLALQNRLHWLLHGWLRIHLPLSAALLALVVLHVVTALYY
jgi:hypothetical protein